MFLQGGRFTVKGKGGIFGEGKYVFLLRRKITEKEKEDHLQEAGPSG